MSIDATKPLATDLVSSLNDYIQADREQINLLWAAITAADPAETNHEMGLGDFFLDIGIDLKDVILEIVNLTAAGAVDLRQIRNGSGGMLKIIKAGDANVTVKHDASYIDLAGDVDFALTDTAVLGLINSGGDQDAGVNGVWYEVFRGGGASGASVYTAVNMTAGQTSLVAGTDLNAVGNEVVGLTADAAVNLTTITLGESGNVKLIIALDDDVTVVQNTGSTTGGTFYLNSPAGVDLGMATGDVLAVTNIGGDGVTAHGYWRELYRTLHV